MLVPVVKTASKGRLPRPGRDALARRSYRTTQARRQGPCPDRSPGRRSPETRHPMARRANQRQLAYPLLRGSTRFSCGSLLPDHRGLGIFWCNHSWRTVRKASFVGRNSGGSKSNYNLRWRNAGRCPRRLAIPIRESLTREAHPSRLKMVRGAAGPADASRTLGWDSSITLPAACAVARLVRRRHTPQRKRIPFPGAGARTDAPFLPAKWKTSPCFTALSVRS